MKKTQNYQIQKLKKVQKKIKFKDLQVAILNKFNKNRALQNQDLS